MIGSITHVKDSKSPLDALVEVDGHSVGVTVLTGTKAMRQLNATLMDLAVYLAKHPDEQVVLMLEEPEISQERFFSLEKEVSRVFKEAIREKLSWRIVKEDGRSWDIWQSPATRPSGLFSREDTQEILNRIRTSKPSAMRRPSDSYVEVLRVLLLHWIRQEGFQSKKSLQEGTGYSFQTVQKVLKELEPWLQEDSAKSVKLVRFPEAAWNRMVNLSEKVRATSGYVASDGDNRPVSVMLKKLEKKDFFKGRVAIGGVEAGRTYDRDFDLVGTPRLDLCVHHHKTFDTEKMLRTLDPALRPAEKGEAPHVVVHQLYRTRSFFRQEGGRFWVDEVECLLDLYEMRLVEQANRMLRHFKERAE